MLNSEPVTTPILVPQDLLDSSRDFEEEDTVTDVIALVEWQLESTVPPPHDDEPTLVRIS